MRPLSARRSAPFDPPLYLVSDRASFTAPAAGELFAPAEWECLVAAMDAGLGALQLREKDLDGGPLLRRAETLVAAARKRGVKLLVNDRADVACAAGADGVHLPEAGLSVADARAIVGAGRLVGRSVHGRDAIAASAGVDFLLFGPVFDTASKRRFGAPQGLARLEEACAASVVPVLAIGGITPERIADVLACGAAGVAVQGAVLRASDPKVVVADLVRALARSGAT